MYLWGLRFCKIVCISSIILVRYSLRLIFSMLTAHVPSYLTNLKKQPKKIKLREEVRNGKKLKEKGRNELKEEEERGGYLAETNKQETDIGCWEKCCQEGEEENGRGNAAFSFLFLFFSSNSLFFIYSNSLVIDIFFSASIYPGTTRFKAIIFLKKNRANCENRPQFSKP